jgi:large subunit ribosomal protein L19
MGLLSIITEIQKDQLKTNVPNFSSGDIVRVGILIRERNKQRIQSYLGTVIAQHRAGSNSTITVRRVFHGVYIEQVFLVHSKSIEHIEILRHSKVRRAKLYYLRNLKGKATRLRERYIKSISI